jgi:hypothetical protein
MCANMWMPHGMFQMTNLINIFGNLKVSHGMSHIINLIEMCVNVKVPHDLFIMNNLIGCYYMYDYMSLTNANN